MKQNVSRIARKNNMLPSGIDLGFKEGVLTATGPKGTLNMNLPAGLTLIKDESGKFVSFNVEAVAQGERDVRRLSGLYSRLLDNVIKGVKDGFEEQLEMVGVGYKANVQGNKVVLAVGFSHLVEIEIPSGIKVDIEKNVLIKISGMDKQVVGHFAAIVRSKKPPEPYKGKGIKYVGERIIRKAGKTVASK